MRPRNKVAAALLLGLWMQAAVADPLVPVPDGYRMDDYRAPVPDSVPGARVIDVPGLKDLSGRAVLIDVLPAQRKPAGSTAPWLPVARHNLPGSVWLSDVGRGALAPAAEAWFGERLAALTGGDKARPVVFYCLRDCWMSWNAARRAALLGYTDVVWFPGGTEAWAEASGLTQVATPEFPPGP